MEVEFLLAGDGLAVFRSWVKGPLLDGCNDAFVDSMAKAAGHFDVGNLALGIDDDVEDDVAFGAMREGRQVRLWRGKVADQSDVDVAGAQGVGARGRVRLC